MENRGKPILTAGNGEITTPRRRDAARGGRVCFQVLIMKTLLGAVILLAGAAIPGAAVANTLPFVDSRAVPHAVLYLNFDQIPQKIRAVRIWKIDGRLSNRFDRGVLWLRPGDYTFTVMLKKVMSLRYAPGLAGSSGYRQDAHRLQLKVEAGKAYYLGAKLETSGEWQPVVWKTSSLR